MEELEALIKRFGVGQERGETEEKRAVVLFIDDDESMRRGLSRALSHKYEVLTAGSGREGLEVMDGGGVECVILDVKMREMNGFETYGKVKEKDPNVPIIFYTAFQSEHDLQDVINKYKPEGYVEKGRDVGFLEHLVDRAVEKYRLVKENEEYRKDLERKVEERTAELKAAYEELRAAEARLIEAERIASVGRLVSSLSHKLKNPIISIERLVPEINENLNELITLHLTGLLEGSLDLVEKQEVADLIKATYRRALTAVAPSGVQRVRVTYEIEQLLRKAKEQGPSGYEDNFGDCKAAAEELAKIGTSVAEVRRIIPLLRKVHLRSLLGVLTCVFALGNQLKNSRAGLAEISSNVFRVLNAARKEKEDPTKKVDLSGVIEQALDLLAHKLEGVEVEKTFTKIPSIECYPTDLRDAFMYLIENGIDAMDGKGRLAVKTDWKGPWAYVVITDSGKQGMSEEVKARLFEPFFTTKERGKGTGLGCYEAFQIIVNKHGGAISYDSRPGKTDCVIRIPIRLTGKLITEGENGESDGNE